MPPLIRWVVLAVLFTTSGNCCAQWKAGLAREAITPIEPMWMAGYAARTRPAEGKIHDLWAKALVLEDEVGGRVLLITLDLLGIDRDFAQRIHQRLKAEAGWERSRVALCTSHTHSGPVVGTLLLGMYPLDVQQRQWVQAYTRNLEDKLVKLAQDAADSPEPMQVGWATGLCSIAVNRRNNPEPEVTERRATGQLVGPVDHDVPILVLRDSNHDVRGLVFGYACHATTLSDQMWCGDWPGFAQVELETRFPKCQAMFFAGCGGDQNPLPRRELELAQNYGRALADSVQAAIETRTYPLRGPIAIAQEDIPLPFSAVPTVESLKAIVAAVESDAEPKPSRYEVARAVRLLEQVEAGGAIVQEYPYGTQTWQLGDGPTWVFLSGEVVVDYALRLKQALGPEKTWVAAYANDVMAYIPSERILQEGGYEGGAAMVYYGLPSPWQAGLENKICGTVTNQAGTIKRLRNELSQQVLLPSGYDHQRLMYVLDDEGHEVAIRSTTDWERRRTAILAGMQQMMGPLPDRSVRCPLDVQEVTRERFDGYTRVHLTYASEPGNRVPAHLYLPDTPCLQPRAPAILALHQTSDLGKIDVGFEGKPDRIYAHELATLGYVVLAPDYPSFGELSEYDFDSDRYVSGTMTGVFNHMRAVDLLCERADVDADRLGVIGHSLGGHNAMFVAAFDPRLKVVVTSCGWTPFHHYYEGQKLENWAQDRYMPWMKDVFQSDPDQVPFDFYEVVAALAPRTFYSCSPIHDDNFEVTGVRQVETAAQEVYSLFNAKDELIIRYPETGHSFPEANRNEAYEVIERVLCRGAGRDE
ncbi:MAG: neutral/alkaline non-lysosomal ceramidase N-terminal domain-containing protein [Planctomycetaceae bacterium]|nr:neutral/alkaline non-lysosomal ceramidase N-terminal domain-containing protein [Planctomycetaceae bacterium]